MIRRTLALAGAAVLAVGVSGVSGPAASADSGAGIAQQSQALIAEVMVDMETTVDGVDLRGDAIELQETTGDEPFALNDFALIGCDGTNQFTIVEFGISDEIPAGGKFLVADDEYNSFDGPQRDLRFDTDQSLVPDLVQSAGGVRLADISSSPSTRVDDVKWGSVPTACSSFVDAGELPDDDQSLNHISTAWDLRAPTPENSTT